MPSRHELKTWPAEFRAVRSGVKTFEHRKNDRNFQVSDLLTLREFDPVKFIETFCAVMGESVEGVEYRKIGELLAAFEATAAGDDSTEATLAGLEEIKAAIATAEDAAYSGEVEQREIAYVLQGGGFGVSPGYAVLGLRPPAATAAQLHDNLTVEDLAGWHFAQGQNALLRAENNRKTAEGYQGGPGTRSLAGRWLSMADEADREGRLHLGAAELIRQLAAASEVRAT